MTWIRMSLTVSACVATAVALEAAAPVGVDLASLEGWDIVVAEKALPAVSYAAEELQGLLGECPGLGQAGSPAEHPGAAALLEAPCDMRLE